MFMYVFGDQIIIQPFDPLGEEDGNEAFKWALNVPGAKFQMFVTNMKGILDTQSAFPIQSHGLSCLS